VARYPDEIGSTVLKMSMVLEYIANEYDDRSGFYLKSGLEIFWIAASESKMSEIFEFE